MGGGAGWSRVEQGGWRVMEEVVWCGRVWCGVMWCGLGGVVWCAIHGGGWGRGVEVVGREGLEKRSEDWGRRRRVWEGEESIREVRCVGRGEGRGESLQKRGKS